MMWYEKPLAMSVADICKEYREAKEPDKQVKILAELNGTETTRIAYLLARAGENVEYRYLPRSLRTPDGVNLSDIWSGTPEAAEADAVRANRAELTGSPVEKKPVEEITAKLWRIYLDAVRERGRAIDGRDVEEMMMLRGVAERIGGGSDAEMG